MCPHDGMSLHKMMIHSKLNFHKCYRMPKRYNNFNEKHLKHQTNHTICQRCCFYFSLISGKTNKHVRVIRSSWFYADDYPILIWQTCSIFTVTSNKYQRCRTWKEYILTNCTNLIIAKSISTSSFVFLLNPC